MKIAVLPGDGIGQEVIPAALMVMDGLRTAGLRFEIEQGPLGGAGLEAFDDALPAPTLATAKSADAVLVGSVGTPAYEALAKVRPGSGLLRLRKELGLFANYRPFHIFPELVGASSLKPEVLDGVDLVIVRELNGDLYYGKPRGRVENASGERESINTMRYSESEIRRVARVAFDLARLRRKKLCSVDKANVLETMGLWRDVVNEVGRDYPDVELRHLYADAAAMALVRAPKQFDVMLTPNLFGDILSDEAAVLSGSIGMLPSASLGEGTLGLYEPVHGAAPDIAGQDIANPVGAILSVAMMLRLSFRLEDAASRVEAAVGKVLRSGIRTRDIAEPGAKIVGTRAMGEAVAAAL